jgi:hypothetical protein
MRQKPELNSVAAGSMDKAKTRLKSREKSGNPRQSRRRYPHGMTRLSSWARASPKCSARDRQKPPN